MRCVVDELMHWVFIFMDWWWKIGMLLKVWWNLLNCWIMMKWCFDFKFSVTLSALLCSYTCKQHLGRVWTFERSKFGDFGWKRVGTCNIFDITDDHSLKRVASELQASGHCKLLELGRLSEPQASSHNSFCDLVAWASGWPLKRAVPSSAFLRFLFHAFGDQSRLSKMFLLTCLIFVYTLKPTRTSFESNWTWFCELNLTFGKCPRTPIFSKLVFSQENEIGLRFYTIYVITKNGFAWFHWEITCFTLKMEFFWKSGNVRRTLWFGRFHSNWPVKHTCMHNYTHIWLMCIHSWGNWVVIFSFGSIALVTLKLWNMIRTWLKIIIESDYLENPWWIVYMNK